MQNLQDTGPQGPTLDTWIRLSARAGEGHTHYHSPAARLNCAYIQVLQTDVLKKKKEAKYPRMHFTLTNNSNGKMSISICFCFLLPSSLFCAVTRFKLKVRPITSIQRITAPPDTRETRRAGIIFRLRARVLRIRHQFCALD